MQAKRLRRLALFVLSIAAALSALTGSAAAAGAPILSGGGFNKALSPSTIEFTNLAVNPNGAATEVRTEYADAHTALYTPWQKAGSGTTSVTMPQVIAADPWDEYNITFIAKNSFGTSETTRFYETPNWLIERKAPVISSFGTAGTFTLEFHASIITGKIECAASGSGLLGHKAGEGDSYGVSTSSCSYYQNGKFICHPAGNLFEFRFDGGYRPLGPEFENQRFQYCPEDETSSVLSTGPFALTIGGTAESREHSMSLKASGSINGGWPATVTISGNMFLTGEHTGQEFGWVVWE